MSYRVVVVGGGISGLAAAHRLMELNRDGPNDVDVTLLEASERVGGSIGTEHVSGFLVESGPDSFITEKPAGLQLCERLGITPNLISLGSTRRNIYVVHQGSLVPLPEGFIFMAPTRLWPLIQTPLFSWSAKLRILFELFLPRGRRVEDESMGSFVRRRFGQELLECVAQPLMGGIYAADPELLSLKATMPRFLDLEQTKRSIIWGTWLEQRRRTRSETTGSGARWGLFVSLAPGMQLMVESLAGRLPVGTIRCGTRVDGLEWNSVKNIWGITTDKGEELEANGVILALPAYVAAGTLLSVDSELAKELAAIAYTSTATVTMAYRRADIPNGLDGFGVVVPARERRQIIACSFSSVKYSGRAPAENHLLRAFVGGALQPELFDQSDEAMEGCVRQEFAALLGIKAEPLFSRIYRHPKSMPQYRVGHSDRVVRIKEQLTKHKGLALAGNAYSGVGIADCIHSGESAAEAILEEFKRRET